MPTVRLRDTSENPDAAQALFALSRSWFNHDVREPPAIGVGPGVRWSPRPRD